MTRKTSTIALLLFGSGALLASCSGAADKPAAPPRHDMAGMGDMAGMAHGAGVTRIPASLAPFGKGYPAAGGPCRRLGESPATARWLDDSAILVGCPKADDAGKLGGQVVDTVDGITLVSIPTGAAAKVHASHDALVPGTQFNATTKIPCGMKWTKPTQSCDAGVKRNWGIDGTAMVVVTKPDGRKRALFFRDGQPLNADSSQADSSAGWTFTGTRKGDEVTIRFGPETYIVPDALVVGG